MTYDFRNPNVAVRRIGGLGDDAESAIANVIAAFLPKLNEIQAASDAQAQAQVDQIIASSVGGKSAAPVTTTSSGSTSPSSVGGGDFVVVGSVCKPRDFPALTAAKDLQMQLNRVARVRGYGTISVDGAIGSGTVNLMAKVGPEMGAIGFSDCTVVTSQLGSLTARVKTFADSLSAPPASATDLARAASAGSISVPTTTGKIAVFKPPGAKASIMDRINAMPDVVKLGAIGAAGLGAILLIRRVRGRSRGPSPSASTTMLALPAQTNPARRRRRRARRR